MAAILKTASSGDIGMPAVSVPVNRALALLMPGQISSVSMSFQTDSASLLVEFAYCAYRLFYALSLDAINQVTQSFHFGLKYYDVDNVKR